MLKLTDIHASYNKKEILRGISLKISEGEITTLIGSNGAGKSTLLKVISGLLIPEQGKVLFAEKDITSLSTHLRVRLGISYFLQGGNIFPHLRVCDNLELGAINLNNGHTKEKIDELLTLFPSLKDKLFKRAGLLSGGQKQMLALCIVLMTKPKLLLLDEPSAGLAPSLVREMLDKVTEININYGTTILLVEQNIKEGIRVSDKVLLLKEGLIVEEGVSREKMTEEIVEKLFLQ